MGSINFLADSTMATVATESRRTSGLLQESDVRRLGLTSDAASIGKGLFPLSSSVPGEELLGQWMRYLQALRNVDNYQLSLPPEAELNRRDSVLKDAFEGLVETKLAVYIVPSTYHLAEVCEIFETLNLIGTKVSTVDLIHSWLFAETNADQQGILRLREWIADFGQRWSHRLVLTGRPA